MENQEDDYLSDSLKETHLYRMRPVVYHGYVLPFALLYLIWSYVWISFFGFSDYFEAGMIGYAIIGLLQVLCCLFCYWFVQVQCLFTCSKVKSIEDSTHVRVVPAPNHGHSELVLRHKDNVGGQDSYWFEFQKTVFIYDSEEKKCFKEVDYPVDWKIKKYMEWKGYAEEDEIKKAEQNFGLNKLQMDIPKFIDLFVERATAPFFVFQVFCVGLWCLDEYWYYSLFTLAMLVIFEATLVQQQLRNMTEIRKMGNKPYIVQVYRNRKWRPIMSDQLVPGDLVSVGRSQAERLVPCDILLLRGSCIIDEAMLTGESVPVMKEPIEGLEEEDQFAIETHGKLHVLYGGTKIVQHTPPLKNSAGIKATDNGCVGFVLRHSFSTSQGKLLKTILFGVKRVTANNLEVFIFIIFLLFFAIIAASYVWIVGGRNPTRNKYKLFLECTLILTSVVPPELPIELSLAVNTSLIALSKLYVFCTEPFRIPFAGKVDVCCFDKTGTLTSDNLVVEGIAGLDNNKSELQSTTDVGTETTQVLATCHSLVQLDDQLVGDPLEKATLNAVQWNLTKGDGVVPRKFRNQHGLKIYHRYHFSSALKRMSVIAGHTAAGNTEVDYIATVKGAPEVIKDMLLDVPNDFEKVYMEHTRQGSRVLALAHKHIGRLSHQQLRDMSRSEVESGLNFAGFLVISCPLKKDSAAVIHEILSSSHYVVMITGDNALTACHVASELRITNKKHPTVILTRSSGDSGDAPREWVWRSVDGSVELPLIRSDADDVKQLKNFNLCLTGEGIDYLAKQHSNLFKRILPSVKVHARVAPKQKEFIVITLKQLGFTTLMCGDGTNDVGALRHAHVGVALLANAPEKLPSSIKRKDEHSSSTLLAGLGPRSGRYHSSPRLTRRNDDFSDLPSNQSKKIANILEKMKEEDDRVVKLGDASIASPFTSKLSTTFCVCHIIKQGRCTLVTTLQMFKILALNALILAYSQSVLYLDGVKFSDTQATAQGLLLAGCFLFISRSKPLDVLSKERPLPNIFNVYTILTVLSQFIIHFGSLIYLKEQSELRSPPKAEGFVDLEEKFKPTLINTVVYVMSMFMQITTFAVNYKGHPFMASLTENKPLLYSLLISTTVIFSLVIGLLPDFSDYIQLVPLESEFSNLILTVLIADFICSFVVDRLLQLIFSRGKLKALTY